LTLPYSLIRLTSSSEQFQRVSRLVGRQEIKVRVHVCPGDVGEDLGDRPGQQFHGISGPREPDDLHRSG
jgi:hypothetical protein